MDLLGGTESALGLEDKEEDLRACKERDVRGKLRLIEIGQARCL
jgi:hypothetical protein